MRRKKKKGGGEGAGGGGGGGGLEHLSALVIEHKCRRSRFKCCFVA